MPIVKWLVFCATVLPLILMPGPDIIYVTTRGIAQGRRAALVSTTGVCAGYLVHTFLAVLGLTSLLSMPTVLSINKFEIPSRHVASGPFGIEAGDGRRLHRSRRPG